MKKTMCSKCGRDIANCNFDRHVNVCDGTFFSGPVNPSKVKSKRTQEEIKELRRQNAAKARESRIGQSAWNKGTLRYTEDEIFAKDGKGPVRKLFMQKVDYKCSCCGLSSWNGNPITLEMDHINGDKTDNRLENLRLLCPNCHSQTPTYKNKNKNGKRQVSDQAILSALSASDSIRQTLIAVGLEDQGANYKRVRRVIEKYNVKLSW